jgi:hypothetical protein
MTRHAKPMRYLLIGACLGLVVFTPIAGDDFVVLLEESTNVRINQSWLAQFGFAHEIIISGTHFNYFGQLISLLAIKFWIGLSNHLGISLIYGFWAIKLFLIVTLTIHLKHFFVKLSPVRVLDSNIFLFCLILFFQLHPFSNDPISSFPLTGYLSLIFAIVALTTFIAFVKSPTPFRFLLTCLATISAILIYEINVAIIFFEFTYLCYLTIYKKNFKLVIAIASKIFLTVLSVLLLMNTFAPISKDYSGTDIRLSNYALILKTLLVNSVTALPGVALLAFFPKVSSRYIIFQLIYLALILLLITLLIQNSKFIQSYKEESTQSQKVEHLSLLIFSLSALFIQAATYKMQLEYSKLGDVYISYLYGALGFSFLIYILVGSVIVRLEFEKISVVLIMLVCITLVSNSVSFGVLWKVNQINVNILASISDPSQNSDRCRLENDWLTTNHPDEYKFQVANGFNAVYRGKMGNDYCK